jgi:hypothetical protein
MSRRFPSVYASFAIAFVLIVAAGAVPCAAEDALVPGDVVSRPGQLRDAINPGDDDQPTISGRRRSQATNTTGAPSGPDAGPNAQYTQEPSPQPEIPVSVLRTWIAAVRALVERFETDLR